MSTETKVQRALTEAREMGYTGRSLLYGDNDALVTLTADFSAADWAALDALGYGDEDDQ